MIRQAQYQAEIETQKARAQQAGPLSEATARQAVVGEEVKVERMRTQELIAVQEQEVLRRQKELEATVIKPAEADRLAAVVRAEGAKQSAILEAEGRRSALIALAEAEQEKLRKEGGGRAAAVEAEGRAEAAKIEAIGLAQAKAIEAQGVAEATAILRKAEAWKEFNDAARLQTILEKLPAIIEASTGVFGAVAAPLGNIDKLVVIDQGNGASENGASSLGRLARTSPAIVFNFLQQLEALGLNVPTHAAAARRRGICGIVIRHLAASPGRRPAPRRPPAARVIKGSSPPWGQTPVSGSYTSPRLPKGLGSDPSHGLGSDPRLRDIQFHAAGV